MMWYHVRIAEWSKAPDSRTIVVQCFGVLVSSGGVGSNPTSDRDLFFYWNSFRMYLVRIC